MEDLFNGNTKILLSKRLRRKDAQIVLHKQNGSIVPLKS